MKKILFVDCCLRGENSRTKKVANAFMDVFRHKREYSIQIVELNNIQLSPLDRRGYEYRETLLAEKKIDNQLFDVAKQFALADLIVIAAPFWDMGIPAKLKIYFENVSVSGFTFKCDESGFHGLCKAREMVHLTTRGMSIEDGDVMEQASPYLIALCKFFGIGGFEMVSAVGLDEKPNEVEELVSNACVNAAKLAEKIIEEYK